MRAIAGIAGASAKKVLPDADFPHRIILSISESWLKKAGRASVPLITSSIFMAFCAGYQRGRQSPETAREPLPDRHAGLREFFRPARLFRLPLAGARRGKRGARGKGAPPVLAERVPFLPIQLRGAQADLAGHGLPNAWRSPSGSGAKGKRRALRRGPLPASAGAGRN